MTIEIRELESMDFDAVTTLWREASGVVVRDVDRREPLTAYLARNRGAAAFWTRIGWSDRLDVRLMSHVASGSQSA